MTADDSANDIGERSLAETYPELEVLSSDPENAELAARTRMDRFLTPRNEHYVRNHHPTPRINEDEWTVSLTGVDENAAISMADLKKDYSTESLAHTMQCSGNGRAFFEPDAGGHQWTTGAVGTAIWTGTPVSEVLNAHDVDTTDGRWIAVMGGEAPEDADVFCRSIPMGKAMDDCLLAYEMNGAPLGDDHGFPVRLLVPGWFGNNSVKWVSRVHVMDGMVAGDEWNGNGEESNRDYTRWQQVRYRIVPEGDEFPTPYESIETPDTYEQLTAAGEGENAYLYDQLVTSLITTPAEGTTITPSETETVEITGMTWGGDDAVERVELSTDGGETWADAELFDAALGRYAWRRFEYTWTPEPESGERLLVSRATNERGRSQPATISAPESGYRGIENGEFPWNQRGYASNAYRPYGVTVRIEDGADSDE